MDTNKESSKLTVDEQKEAEVAEVHRKLKWIWELKTFPSREIIRSYLEELGRIPNHVWLASRLLKTVFMVSGVKTKGEKEDRETKEAIDKVLMRSGGSESKWDRNIVRNYINILSKVECLPVELTTRLLKIYYEWSEDKIKVEAENTITASSEEPRIINFVMAKGTGKTKGTKIEKVSVSTPQKKDVSSFEAKETETGGIETRTKSENVSVAAPQQDSIETVDTKTVAIVTVKTDRNKIKEITDVITISSDDENDDDCVLVCLTTPEEIKKTFIEHCIHSTRRSREAALRKDLEAVFEAENYVGHGALFSQPTPMTFNGQLALESQEEVNRRRQAKQEFKTKRAATKRKRNRRNKANRKLRLRGKLDAERRAEMDKMADVVVKRLKNEFQNEPIRKWHNMAAIRNK